MKKRKKKRKNNVVVVFYRKFVKQAYYKTFNYPQNFLIRTGVDRPAEEVNHTIAGEKKETKVKGQYKIEFTSITASVTFENKVGDISTPYKS